MCLIIYKPRDKVIPKEFLKDAHKENPHGWGLMRTDPINITKIHKSHPTNFNEFDKIYQAEFAEHECAIHFRYSTGGEKTRKQAHPFFIAQNVWFMHNGHIVLPQWNDKQSDTWHFAQYLKGMVEADWLTDEDFIVLIETALGRDRGIILNKDEFIFLNKEFWIEHEGIWYSNTYACPSLDKIINPPKKENPKKDIALPQSLVLNESKEIIKPTAIYTIDYWIELLNHNPEKYDKILAQAEKFVSPLELALIWDETRDLVPNGLDCKRNVNWESLDYDQLVSITRMDPDSAADILYNLIHNL